jgi:uncharacterized oligopeptide transporter (OPT) family protein
MTAPDLDPAAVAELDEAAWYATAYRGDQPQLTARAVVTGLALGFVLAFANVYIGLTTGWFFGMALAACLASFAIWRGLAGLGLRPLSLLEANCMQSTASAAAYATGNMVVGIVPAMLLLSVSPAAPRGTQLPGAVLVVWIACIAALGVTLAIPLKRQLINRERLAFPSGTAAAVMLHGLHRRGASVSARAVIGALVTGAALPILRELRGLAILPERLRVLDWLPRVAGHAPSEAGVVLDVSVLLPAAGAFAGLRVTLAMVAGGAITAFAIGPVALRDAWLDPTGHTVYAARGLATVWLDAGIWLGAPLLAAYALVTLAARWRLFGRALRRGPEARSDLEVPAAWFWIGFAVTGGAAIALARALFDIPVPLGALAVALSLVFSSVACRITGETDIQPGAAMGKLTQLVFGALRPQHPTTNLMTAAMTHASSVASADLLNDLKAGYLLGANPRRQTIAQALGIAAGAVASVLAYFLLVPDASALAPGPDGVARFAAPGAHQFRAIAELLQYGLAHLHPLHRALVVIGALAGAVLAIAERLVRRRWWPSTAGLGLGLLLPLATSLAMALGAIAAALAHRRDATRPYVWPIAAGALAGESIAGVAVALANTVLG